MQNWRSLSVVFILSGQCESSIQASSSCTKSSNFCIKIAITIHRKVRQGYPLSSVVLNYAVDWIMSNEMIGYPSVQLSPALYISDLGTIFNRITLCGTSRPESQHDENKSFSNHSNPRCSTTFHRDQAYWKFADI